MSDTLVSPADHNVAGEGMECKAKAMEEETIKVCELKNLAHAAQAEVEDLRLQLEQSR